MTNSVQIKLVPIEAVHQLLPFAKPFIVAGMVDSDLTYGQVKVFLANGSWHLAIALNEREEITGAYTFTISNTPNDRTVTVVSAAGLGLGSPDCFEQLVGIVKRMGATKIQALASESAARLYKRIGLREKSRLLERKL